MNSNFVEHSVILDEGGVLMAVITYKMRPNGTRLYSWTLMRSFDDNGVQRRTPWANTRHLDAAARLIPRVKAALDELEKSNG